MIKSPPLSRVVYSKYGKLDIHLNDPIFLSLASAARPDFLSAALTATKTGSSLTGANYGVDPEDVDKYVDPALWSSYLSNWNIVNQILSLSLQLKQDLNLTNHKYMAHQLALLHVPMLNQCLNTANQVGFTELLAFKLRIEEKFTEVKVASSSSPSPQLDSTLKQWLDSLCSDISQHISDAFPLANQKSDAVETIMGPVADAISQLMVINLEAEARNTILPDLTGLAVVVDSQAKNLVDVGRSMVESGDAQLKREMPPACDLILEASALLVEAADDIKLNPKGKPGRDKLLKACSGLLESTVKLLDVYDDCEVRRIVGNCDICITNLETLKTILDLQGLISHVKPTGQQLVDVTAIARNRVDEILQASLQNRLRAAIDNIANTSSLLVSSSKAVVQNPKSEHALTVRTICCDNIISNLRDIQVIVQTRDLQEADFSKEYNNLQDTRKDVYKQLAAVMTSIQEKDEFALQNALDILSFGADLVLNNANEIAAKSGVAGGKVLQAQVLEIQKVQTQIVTTANAAVKSGSDKDQTAAHGLLVDAEGKFKNLESAVEQALSNQIRDFIFNNKNEQDKDTSLYALVNLAKTSQPENFQPYLAEKIKEKKAFCEALQQLGKRASDPETFKAISQIEKGIEDTANLLEAAAATVNIVPQDKSSGENFDAIVQVWKTQIEKADEAIKKHGLLKASEVVNSDVMQLKYGLEQFIAVKQYPIEKSAVVKNAMKRIVQSAKDELERTEDPKLKADLAQQLVVLEKDLAELQKASTHFNDAKQYEMFASAGKVAVEDASKFAKTIQVQDVHATSFSLIPAPITAKTIENVAPPPNSEPVFTQVNGEEVQVVDAAPPEELTEEEAKQNPIKAAARDLNIVTSQWSKNENAMVDKSSTLAEKMDALARYFKEDTPNAKKMMITISKEIYEECGKFIAEAQKIHDRCTDKSLKTQLRLAIESISTLSVQLKIVTAVKVAESKDVDSEKQLILCCQNLMNAIKVTIKASEVASLRGFRVAGKAALGMVKFRKILYKKKGVKSP